MSSQMVTVQRTDPDGTVHTYAWPKSLAEADATLTIVKDDPATTDGYRKPVAKPAGEPVTEPAESKTDAPVAEPGKPAGKPVTEPKKQEN